MADTRIPGHWYLDSLGTPYIYNPDLPRYQQGIFNPSNYQPTYRSDIYNRHVKPGEVHFWFGVKDIDAPSSRIAGLFQGI